MKERNEMKTTIFLILVAIIAISVPAMSARVVNIPIPHEPFCVFQAYCGQTCLGITDGETATNGFLCQNHAFLGLRGPGADVITAVPGVLSIVPGTDSADVINWSNYVSAAAAGIAYTVTNTTLRKTVPTYECTQSIGGAAVLQQGTANIRRWWPLMYELPGTCWVLTITYRTSVWDDDGTAGPNLPATTHQDVWKWCVCADLDHLINLVDLFHELPVGSCQVPLISSESLYAELIASIQALQAMDPADPEMSEAFNAFILLIEDNCLTVDCGLCVPELGIRNTTENPACCKLLADADFIADALQVNIPSH